MLATTPLSPLVRHLRTRSPLSDEDERALNNLPHQVRVLRAGQYVIREGDRPRFCCALLSGFVVRSKIVGSGLRQIVGVHVPGDLVDLQNAFLSISDHDVQTLTNSSIAYIPVEAIEQIASESSNLARALWIETLVDGSIFREWVANVGRRDARQRIAHILCEFAIRLEAIRTGEQRNYEFPMSQEQLADAVGLTPVHVNRTLRGFDAEGLIERTHRSIIIQNWRELAAIGDFRATYLHLDEGRREAAE